MYYYTRCYHWGELDKGYTGPLHYFYNFYVKLKLFLDNFFFNGEESKKEKEGGKEVLIYFQPVFGCQHDPEQTSGFCQQCIYF